MAEKRKKEIAAKRRPKVPLKTSPMPALRMKNRTLLKALFVLKAFLMRKTRLQLKAYLRL